MCSNINRYLVAARRALRASGATKGILKTQTAHQNVVEQRTRMRGPARPSKAAAASATGEIRRAARHPPVPKIKQNAPQQLATRMHPAKRRE